MSRFSSVIKQTSGKLDRVISIILIMAILIAIGAVVYVAMNWGTGEKFSEFYILGSEGKAEGYPEALAVGEKGEVILDIVNQEQEAMSYIVEITIGETLIEEIGPIALAHEEVWEEEVGFVSQEPGDNQKVEFKLFKIRQIGENKETLLSLWLGREYLNATITNQGQTETTYEMNIEIEARVGEDDEKETHLITPDAVVLGPGEAWDTDLDYIFPEANWQNAELFLYRDGELIYEDDALGGYPALHLWIAMKATRG